MNHKIKRVFSILLAVSMTFVMTACDTSLRAPEHDLTCAKASEIILSYCDEYNKEITADTLLRGHTDGAKQETKAVTRIEALVMLRQAFAPLPKPDAYWGQVSATDALFTDVPEWAAEDIAALTEAGILTAAEDSLLKPDEVIDRAELDRYLYRIFAAYGTNLEDDFFSTVNREQLKSAKLLPGQRYAGPARNISYEISKQLRQIISEVVNSDTIPGTSEHLIKAFYTTYLEKEAQPSNFTPIQPWLEAIDRANSITELDQVSRDILAKTGINILLGFALEVDPLDSTRYMPTIWTLRSNNGIEFYQSGSKEEQQSYIDYLVGILGLTGCSEEQAQSTAQEFYRFETELSKAELSVDDLYDPEKVKNPHTLAEIQQLLPGIDVAAELATDQLQEEARMNVQDPGAIAFVGNALTDEKIETAKAVLRVNLLFSFQSCWGEDFYQLESDYNRQRYGEKPDVSPEERAVENLDAILSGELGELYVAQHFSERAKEDATEMIHEILEVYEERIDELGWMSNETKVMAKKKLATMAINVGYPDRWPKTFDGTQLKTAEEGGTYFDNYSAIYQAITAETSSMQGHPVDRTEWLMPVYEVNAYYLPSNNSINFPVGILQPPYYDVNASREKNLGGIGTVMAHEISHAFDNSGAMYDENGNVRNWWTQTDYAEFERHCEAIVNYYDGFEVLPGATTSGKLTLGENIADLAAISCLLELLEQTDSTSDYKEFFESFAAIFANIYSPGTARQMCATDPHSLSVARINRVLSSMDMFYETYGITENDGMYVPPEERVGVW